MLQHYGIALRYEPLGTAGRCGVQACAYPGRGILVFDEWRGTVEKRIRCWWHFMTDASPLSMEYEDADALCGVPRHRSRAFDGKAQTAAQMEQGAWNAARTSKYTFSGRDFRRIVRVVRRQDESAVTHLKDPVYHLFALANARLLYGACGEKFHQSLACKPGDDPTCEICQRIYRTRVAELPKTPARSGFITAPRSKTGRLDFEELVAAGVMDANEAAFSNRRNWGERSGREWNDRTAGTQKSMHRWDRGGVNRKRK